MRTLAVWLIVVLAGCASNPVAPGGGDPPAYDRDAWVHWVDDDGDCLDTRAEVLQAESLAPVTMEGCRVVGGLWVDPYTALVFVEAVHLDVDHLVPLKEAHESGGWAWDAARKRAYANELGDPDHLVAVDRSANRSKGSRGPDAWLPDVDPCGYVDRYLAVKMRWNLTIRPEEEGARCHGR